MADRIKGIQVHRPIIYGSHSRLLTEEERASAPEQHTHKWTVFVTSAATPPPKEGDVENIDYIPGGADDLGYMIKRISFKLYDTYPNANRVIDRAPFQVVETGWGEFAVNIRIQFIPEAAEKPLLLTHMIKLHHWGPPIEGPPKAIDSPAPSAPVDTSTAPTPATEPVDEKMTEASAAPTPAPAETKEEDKVDGSAEGVKVETLESAAPSPSIVAVQPGLTEAPTQFQPVSIATKLPVHSWQYDEIVFNDPPAAFLEILNEHPPTPLPAKFRRPKDQREKEEGPKKKKGRPSTIRGDSRAQTQEPGAAGTPVPAGPVVGIPGESGSADVPLEFAKEMETGEFNRLTDARLTIIDQMDKWRTRLIAQEKELAKLKEEMKIS